MHMGMECNIESTDRCDCTTNLRGFLELPQDHVLGDVDAGNGLDLQAKPTQENI